MQRFSLSIFTLIISITCISAQNNTDAEKVINNLIASVKTNAVSGSFTMTISAKNPVNSQSISGTFIMKDNKFALNMNEVQAWYDGTTQWVHTEASNEVSITEPAETELADINPLALLSNFKAASNTSFGKSQSAQNHLIVLKPKVKNATFTRVEIIVNKATENPVSLSVTAKDGAATVLTLSNYRKGIKTSDDTFVFNKAKYKNIIINDLR